ncbi:HMCN2 protein, partial [Acrocephalus arundinaceus]|nr:HMCN2 protein [Acrocephalus arundinaceus]
PVANVTITPSPPAHQVHTGDPVTLRCSVQVVSAPVTFTWLHNGQEVSQGPVLELGNVSVGHSGTYQCVATNQLGQDGHRVFRALSPELALEVTPQGHWNRGGVTQGQWDFRTPRVTADPDVSLLSPAVATGVGVSLLFLVLLMGVAVGWQQWNNIGSTRKGEGSLQPSYTFHPNPQDLSSPFHSPPYSHRAPPEPLAPPGEDPQATYMELQGPHGQPWEPSDIYENLQ